MYPIWHGLLANLALVALVILLWTNISGWCERRGAQRAALAFGLVMGAGSILAISLAFEIVPGVKCDLRVAPIAIAGLFGGPFVAAVAVAPVVAYRLWLGGMGAPSGCLSLLAIAATAVACRSFFSTPSARSTLRVAFFAVLTTFLGHLVGWAFAPHSFSNAMAIRAMTPMFILNALTIYFGSFALLQEDYRRRLASRNALYSAVIKALPDCLNVKDAEGRFIVANPATARLMGASSVAELIGKSDFDFYPEATAHAFRAEEQVVLDGGRAAKTFEQRTMFRDGGEAWLSTLKAPFYNAAGEFVGLITHNRDITEAKRLQLKLQETQMHLASALTNMADGLVVYDRDGRIVLCNEHYRALFPLTADLRVEGAYLADIIREAVRRGEERVATELDVEALIAKVMSQLRRRGERLISLGDGRCLEAKTRPTSDGGALTIFADVTDRIRRERDLHFRAEHDPLTMLANRATFQERLEAALETGRLTKAPVTLLAVDLDHFKRINDSFGHPLGDQLLREIADRLRAACGPGDLVARLGGDEFAIVSEREQAFSEQAAFAQSLVEAGSQLFEHQGVRFRPSCSVGVASAPLDARSSDSLIACADAALYVAKKRGRGVWAAYHAPADEVRKAS